MKKMQLNQYLKYAVVLASVSLLSSPAYAAPEAKAKKTEPEKTVPATPLIPAVSEKAENPILSVVTVDLNSDKRTDAAILLKSGDQADLYLYQLNAAGDMELKLTKKNIVWSGALAGTLPQLKTARSGVLLIYSENDAIGRNRWHQRLSVDYRDNDFQVTGYSYDERDTLDTKSGSSCDVNLLTGKGIKDKKSFKIESQKIKLSDWSDEKAPKECRN